MDSSRKGGGWAKKTCRSTVRLYNGTVFAILAPGQMTAVDRVPMLARRRTPHVAGSCRDLLVRSTSAWAGTTTAHQPPQIWLVKAGMSSSEAPETHDMNAQQARASHVHRVLLQPLSIPRL